MNATAIADAIAALYAGAGELAPSAIVPLDALLAEQPLFRAELPGLTRGRAIAYLRQRTGADLPEPPAPKERLAGFLYSFLYEGEVWGCILVDQDDIVERRRFSAAHELGHYLLHFQPWIKEKLRLGQHLFLSEGFSYDEEPGAEPEEALPGAASLCAQDFAGAFLDAIQLGTPELEAQANRFAAELLMPEATCRALWGRKEGVRSFRRLAQELLVSPAAMKVRLSSLGLVS